MAELLPRADTFRREPLPVSELALALQCGGSDGFSGITANPALGHAVDLLVAQGGTAVLSETPEIYGAEHLLTRRAVSREVGEQLIERIHWWEAYTEREGFVIDNNPAPGNKAGGLTTIYEKSLGAVAKGGSTPLTAVYDYAEPITRARPRVHGHAGLRSGLGDRAGGRRLQHRRLHHRARQLLRLQAGTQHQDRHQQRRCTRGCAATWTSTPDASWRARPSRRSAARSSRRIVAVASGEPSLSEAQGIGEEEFNPWILGATL